MTYITKIIAIATTGILASCSQVNDQPKNQLGKKKGHSPSPEKLFEKLDTDSSGSLSSTEFQTRPSTSRTPSRTPSQEMIQKRFTSLDSNSDGQISLAEFKAQPLRKRPR